MIDWTYLPWFNIKCKTSFLQANMCKVNAESVWRIYFTHVWLFLYYPMKFVSVFEFFDIVSSNWQSAMI